VQAASELPVDGLLFVLCDQPLITPADLRDLNDIWRGSGGVAAAARYGGKPGVPAVFSRSEFPALLALPDESGAKSHLIHLAEHVALLEMPHAAADVDTPGDADRISRLML
jgi:molybdenum cofactor cytidylyltransferase